MKKIRQIILRQRIDYFRGGRDVLEIVKCLIIPTRIMQELYFILQWVRLFAVRTRDLDVIGWIRLKTISFQIERIANGFFFKKIYRKNDRENWLYVENGTNSILLSFLIVKFEKLLVIEVGNSSFLQL